MSARFKRPSPRTSLDSLQRYGLLRSSLHKRQVWLMASSDCTSTADGDTKKPKMRSTRSRASDSLSPASLCFFLVSRPSSSKSLTASSADGPFDRLRSPQIGLKSRFSPESILCERRRFSVPHSTASKSRTRVSSACSTKDPGVSLISVQSPRAQRHGVADLSCAERSSGSAGADRNAQRL
eukprot:scaffold194_cov277-Pinguiococcus_pyrenoidosus.AAC.19